jgi:tetratricopeptide (TPR) repeat protein
MLLQEIERLPSAGPPNIEQLAFTALQGALQDGQNTLEYASRALVLYRWLLNTVERDSLLAAGYWYYTGIAYSRLITIAPQQYGPSLVEDALACCRVALGIYETQGLSHGQAAVLHNIGNVSLHASMLLDTDRQAQIHAAISAYRTALQFSTPHSEIWARTQHHLGWAYSLLSDRNARTSLEWAVHHYQEALQAYSQQKGSSLLLSRIRQQLDDANNRLYKLSHEVNRLKDGRP